MSDRIPQSFIDGLLSRVDIVEVIEEHVPLKRRGREHVANCPFHDEKTPSFTVSNAKQFYHCFGCGAHGSAIGFLMEYARMDFVDAVRALADRVGMEVPREPSAKDANDGTIPSLYEILDKVAQFYRQQLQSHPQATKAAAYLKHRQLGPGVISEFDIGYAPPGWDTLLRAFGQTKTARWHLLKAGLIVDREGKEPYDRFRDRIIFPIRDGRGRITGFGGRVLGEETPKYLNSPETQVFHKGRELYGLYQARQASRVLSHLLVVEGYMDVVALAERGIRYAVATLGTATTADHLNRLYRAAPKITFCFDADTAGRKAAWRALETVLPLLRDGRQASFAFLPEGEDPDSFIKKTGREAFEAELSKATTLSSFLFEQLLAQVDRSTLDGKARLVDLAKPLLSRLPPGTFRELSLSRLSDLSGLERATLDTQLAGRQNPKRTQSLNATRNPNPSGGPNAGMPGKPTSRAVPSLMRKVILLLLHNPHLAIPTIDKARLCRLALPGIPLLVEILDVLEKYPNISTGGLVEHFRDKEFGRHIAKLVVDEPPLLVEGLEQELSDAFDKLWRLSDEQRYEYLIRKSTESPLTKEEKREFSLLLRHATALTT
uniref:DNA primase n=1 Tax=Candidatus Kentrum sp. SD TaxID=2126332 RepID=A0A450YDS4_9GAMM|nr:MAG: DNA primase [Candidatus Kentron sp. SD]VFK39710.1 MAG: DNA primase [Candidatus Kentron sp. SD]